MASLGDRNLMAHTYKEEVAQAVEESIRGRYYLLIEALYETLSAKKAALEKSAEENHVDN